MLYVWILLFGVLRGNSQTCNGYIWHEAEIWGKNTINKENIVINLQGNI